MPRLDLHHKAVKNSLVKDGWKITHDPFVLSHKGMLLFADLGGEKIFSAKLEEKNIVVEIKTFSKNSQMSDFEKAVGQYVIYQFFLQENSLDRVLYLAISEEVYEDFFQKPAIQDIVIFLSINLLVFDPEKEKIVLWTN